MGYEHNEPHRVGYEAGKGGKSWGEIAYQYQGADKTIALIGFRGGVFSLIETMVVKVFGEYPRIVQRQFMDFVVYDVYAGKCQLAAGAGLASIVTDTRRMCEEHRLSRIGQVNLAEVS